MELQYSCSFGEQYDIDILEYADVDITSLPLSNRTLNRLSSNRIRTVADLLRTCPENLMQLKGFGKTCLEEIANCCNEIQSKAFKPGATVTAPKMVSLSSTSNKRVLYQYREHILAGDFSTATCAALSENERAIVEEAREAYEILGASLVAECQSNAQYIRTIIASLNKFGFVMKRMQELWDIIDEIPIYRKNNHVAYYINAFTQDDDKRKALVSQFATQNSSISDFVGNDLYNEKIYVLTKKFLKWCSFDITGDANDLIGAIKSQPRLLTVVQMRARKNTLEKTGNKLRVTRERVRQLEKKALRIFAKAQGRTKLIAKISADKNGDSIITPADIERYCSEYSEELLFLLRNYEGGTYTYDNQLDVFIIGDDSLHDRINAYIETLSEFFPASKMPSLIEKACEDYDLPDTMVEKAIEDAYKLTGGVYHRCRLSAADIYAEILKEHFSSGIKAYDPSEIKRFRDLVFQTYGEVKLPTNDRALTARISRICILCGKGLYKVKQKSYIPQHLAQRIYDYIVDNENSIFLTNTLFSVFEKELRKAGVDNKYYLQGILHEIYGDRLVFSRDYVSKDGAETSIYSSVIDFIKTSKYPVSKSQIKEAFPGISDIVVSFSVGDQSVLNYFGEYLHTSKLRISPEEERYLESVIQRVLSDGNAHHVKDFHDIISVERAEVLSRNAALFPFSTFSVLEYLFRDNFQFSRPYIARLGTDIGRPSERLHDLLYSKDEFTFDDIGEFSRENHYMIQSQLEYVNSCNDLFLIANDSVVMTIDRIGVDEQIAKEVELAVINEVNETMPIRQLTCWGKFPRINVPWTEWLLYSVLNKWSKQLTVAPSSNQFRLSIPLVAPLGMMDVTDFADAYKDPERFGSAVMIAADNLDNLDELLVDMLGDELLEEETWDLEI